MDDEKIKKTETKESTESGIVTIALPPNFESEIIRVQSAVRRAYNQIDKYQDAFRLASIGYKQFMDSAYAPLTQLVETLQGIGNFQSRLADDIIKVGLLQDKAIQSISNYQSLTKNIVFNSGILDIANSFKGIQIEAFAGLVIKSESFAKVSSENNGISEVSTIRNTQAMSGGMWKVGINKSTSSPLTAQVTYTKLEMIDTRVQLLDQNLAMSRGRNPEQGKLSIKPESPFRLDFTAWALRRRDNNIVDQWDGRQYVRIIVIDNNPIKITITQNKKSAELKIVVSPQSVKEITEKVKKETQSLIQKMFGLTINLEPFYTLANGNSILKSLVNEFSGVKPPRFATVFEALINSIACQQVTLDVGITMLNRLSVAFGGKFIESDTISYAFLQPIDLAEVSEGEVKKLGFSYQKARAIKEIATNVMNNKINLESLEYMTNKEVLDYLLDIRGIGRWSAEYVLLRGLGRLDIFPGDDIGAQNNLKRIFHLDNKPSYEEIKNLTSQWQPYAGLVYFHLLLEKLQGRGVI